MAIAPALKGKKVVLQNHDQKFVSPRYVAWLNDPEVVRHSEQRFKKHSLKSCREYVRSYQNNPSLLWAIIVQEGRVHIGNICAIVDARNKTAELRILIGDKSYYGQGLGLESWKLVCDYLLSKGGMRKVFAGTLALNKGMLSIMKKMKMKPQGVWEKHYLVNGKTVDLILAAKFSKKNI